MLVAALLFWGACAQAQGIPAGWPQTLEKARGQTVYFNAWAGDENTNAFIAWVGERVRDLYGIRLVHVKITLTSEVVSRIVAEKAAGRHAGGSVDLVWINGENFLSMKEQGLLFGPFAQRLPNFALVDTAGKPATVADFTVPVDGFESPWRMARVVYAYDAARLQAPPRSIPAMLTWARRNPGRITHPRIRNFLGSTFLKQALYELVDDPKILLAPATDAGFARATAPLWRWYDELKPLMWRKGEQFPETGPAMRQLLADGEIDIMISFNPNEATTAIGKGILPDTVRTFVLEQGTIGNCSFVAIPYNAAHVEGAMAVANFLLSPESQAHAMNPEVMGNPTVLDLSRLSPAERKRFEDLPRGVATLSAAELGRPLLEPHPSWMNGIVAEWERRYTR
ncbi:MAG TPA: ABC transporter substrate-binding protein [Desulfobacterales bacterium]|nr:ABC transporter substrate-binding protein [Desulfobacterales bacterium]